MFVSIPKGIWTPHFSKHVIKLKNGFGLKQAHWAWYEQLMIFLVLDLLEVVWVKPYLLNIENMSFLWHKYILMALYLVIPMMLWVMNLQHYKF